MATVDAELLAVVERSPKATSAHDRAGWVGLFTADGRVEDPYGSQPHAGYDEIGRFYDTFIAPRQIIFHRDVDISVDLTVIRDLMLEIIMAPGVTLNVPMHLRYDVRESVGDFAIERLRAYWELPTMMVPMLRHGRAAIPPSLRLIRALLRNQGVAGAAGYMRALKRPGRRARRCAETLLDAATVGDEMSSRRSMTAGASISLGEQRSLSMGEFIGRVRGGRWFKLIATGDTVTASVETATGRGVVFCEMDSATGKIARIRYFA